MKATMETTSMKTTCNANNMQDGLKPDMDRPQSCPKQWPLTPKLRHQKARHARTHIGP